MIEVTISDDLILNIGKKKSITNFYITDSNFKFF